MFGPSRSMNAVAPGLGTGHGRAHRTAGRGCVGGGETLTTRQFDLYDRLVRLLRPALLVAAMMALVASVPALAEPALLRLDGVGPLKLGMTRTAALDTSWLAHRGRGCRFGAPVPITYRVDGPQAPARVRGRVEFVRGRLVRMDFFRGVRTALGVAVGRTSVAEMFRRYRGLGFSVSSVFAPRFKETFVSVRRKGTGEDVIGGYASEKVVELLSIPRVSRCD